MEYNAKDIFDQMAQRYDTPERAEMAKMIADAIRAELPHTQNKSAMDYGCGTGLVGLELAGSFASILFVDTAPQMVAQVQQKLEEYHVHNASTLCADFAVDVPPGIGTDYILLSQVLLHVKEVPLLLARLFDLLNPGGQLVIVDFDKNENIVSDKVHNGFNQALLADGLKQAGFSAVESHTFFHGEKIFMNQDASMFLLRAAKAP